MSNTPRRHDAPNGEPEEQKLDLAKLFAPIIVGAGNPPLATPLSTIQQRSREILALPEAFVRLNTALEEAQKKGIILPPVRVIAPAKDPKRPLVHLMRFTHPVRPADWNMGPLPRSIFQCQEELFRFLRIMLKHGAAATLHHEGWEEKRIDFHVRIDGRTLNIFSLEAQKIFENNRDMVTNLTQQLSNSNGAPPSVLHLIAGLRLQHTETRGTRECAIDFEKNHLTAFSALMHSKNYSELTHDALRKGVEATEKFEALLMLMEEDMVESVPERGPGSIHHLLIGAGHVERVAAQLSTKGVDSIITTVRATPPQLIGTPLPTQEQTYIRTKKRLEDKLRTP